MACYLFVFDCVPCITWVIKIEFVAQQVGSEEEEISIGKRSNKKRKWISVDCWLAGWLVYWGTSVVGYGRQQVSQVTSHPVVTCTELLELQSSTKSFAFLFPHRRHVIMTNFIAITTKHKSYTCIILRLLTGIVRGFVSNKRTRSGYLHMRPQ